MWILRNPTFEKTQWKLALLDNPTYFQLWFSTMQQKFICLRCVCPSSWVGSCRTTQFYGGPGTACWCCGKRWRVLVPGLPRNDIQDIRDRFLGTGDLNDGKMRNLSNKNCCLGMLNQQILDMDLFNKWGYLSLWQFKWRNGWLTIKIWGTIVRQTFRDLLAVGLHCAFLFIGYPTIDTQKELFF